MGNYTPNLFMTQPAHLLPLAVEKHVSKRTCTMNKTKEAREELRTQAYTAIFYVLSMHSA